MRHFVVGSPIGSHPTMASSNMESTRLKCNTSWSSLFCTLKSDEPVFTPPKLLGDAIVVEPYEEVLEMGCELWENSLVGHFVDAYLSYAIIQCLITYIWGKMDLPTITLLENELIIFQFGKAKPRDWVLHNRP